MNNELAKSLALIVLGLIVIISAGFLNIWALNTLFPALNIPYNGWTWLASTLLAANFINFKKD